MSYNQMKQLILALQEIILRFFANLSRYEQVVAVSSHNMSDEE